MLATHPINISLSFATSFNMKDISTYFFCHHDSEFLSSIELFGEIVSEHFVVQEILLNIRIRENSVFPDIFIIVFTDSNESIHLLGGRFMVISNIILFLIIIKTRK